MKGYGIFLANLRGGTGLSLEGLARLVETSKSTLSRLENDEITQPFKRTLRKLVLALAQMLCASGRETERYLELAGLDRLFLTEAEEFQIGFVPDFSRLGTNASEETVTLQRWEGIYQQLTQQLQERVTCFGNDNIPLQLKMKFHEYALTLQDIERKLHRPAHQDMPIAHHNLPEERRVIVGIMYGKEINTSHVSQDLYALASKNALRLMQRADVDCFAVDDLITLTQSHAFTGWDRDDILITALATSPAVPQDFETLRQEKLPAIQKNFVNSSHYRLISYTPAFSDRKGLEVTLVPVGFHDYYALLPFLDEPLAIGADGSSLSLREKYGYTALVDSCLIPAPVSLQGVIVTKDHQIILMQRSHSVAFYPHHWSASFEETMDAPGLSPKGNLREGDADFFACALRGLAEEFGMPAESVESIKMLSLNIEYLTLSSAIVAIINSHLTVQEIKSHWLVKAPDKNEASKLATVSADLPSVLQKLFGGDVLWHPTSRMRLIQFLFHVYGVDEVVKAIKTRKS